MKKLVVTIVTLLTCGGAYALPIGNPSNASLLCDGLFLEGHCGDPCDPFLNWGDALTFRVGFWGDYVFNRHLQVHSRSRNISSSIEKTKINTNAGFLAANLWDRVDLFTTLGATDFALRSNVKTFGSASNGPQLELETKNQFSWSVGARGTLWECGCTSFGLETQYFTTKPRVHRVSIAESVSVYPDNSISARYQEWQVGGGVAHRINMFVPYLGVKWSWAKVNFDHAHPFASDPDLTLFNSRNKNHWGFAAGVSLIDCEKAALTVEGRYGDERAVHVNGQIRF
jgi:major outer membrane protein